MKKSFLRSFILLPVLAFLTVNFTDCHKNKRVDGGDDGEGTTPPVVQNDVTFYLTKGDQSVLFKKQNSAIPFKSETNGYPDINIDEEQTYQTIDGFGFTLTDGSAQLIDGLPSSIQTELLNELFGNDSNAIGISYLRLTIGASDLSESVYTYDDLPSGETDPDLVHFSLRKDMSKVIPVMKKILAINPEIKILGSPWTAPLWMKTNKNSVGGSLMPEYYDVYASYLVKYIEEMKNEGIKIDAVTPQNEPLHGGNNPSMVMTAKEQTAFIRDHLGPAFKAADLKTKIIIYDHNADRPDYPLTILDDADARQYIDGSAFHLYGGDISALSQVHDAYPSKNIYFTEQYTSSSGEFGGDLRWHIRNVIVGSMRNWSKNALEWNLASDPYYSIHTPGGCNVCRGAVNIISGYTRNVGYYIIAHASKYVVPGSKRIASNIAGNIYNAAFIRPDGRKVLVAVNDGSQNQSFNIFFKGRRATVSLDAGAAGTFVWD